jgi:DNA repair protein RecN (Recombination protein N)
MDQSLYLKNIKINNFATIENETIEFTPHFNAIVGETGSGKSLILDAIQLLLGGRADAKMVRKGTEFSIIEAEFICNDKDVINFFELHGYPFEDSIIIKRILYSNGKNKSYVNHASCNISFLSTFSQNFIDLVGQFENQRLLSSAYQLKLLDRFASNAKTLEEYQSLYSIYKNKQKEFEKLKTSQNGSEQRLDYIKFQLNELNKINISAEEELELINKKNKSLNQEKISNLHHQISTLIDGDTETAGIYSLLGSVRQIYQKNSSLLDQKELEKINNVIMLIEELSFSKSKDVDEVDQDEINEIISKLDIYQNLKRKFSTDTVGLKEIQNQLSLEEEQILSLEKNIQILENEIANLTSSLTDLANKLHKKRSNAAKELGTQITLLVKELNMQGAEIVIEANQLDHISENGNTIVTFKAQTNQGEGYFAIKDIASGGELSRILLSLRQILSGKDAISVFLFDEIDTGVGGVTALSIGKALARVASESQVIAITHLPQIAAYANQIIKVEKSIVKMGNETRTLSLISSVHEKNKINEFLSEMNPIPTH